MEEDTPVDPTVVIENIHAWDGEIVTVEGWLGECKGLDCHIHSTLTDMLVVNLTKPDDRWMAAMNRSLSIAFEEEFDASAEPLQFSYVQVKGKVNDECWQATCTDRVNHIEPILVRAISTDTEGDLDPAHLEYFGDGLAENDALSPELVD